MAITAQMVKELTGNSNEETSLSIKQNIESSKVIQSSEDNEAGFDLEERISSINIDAIQLTDLNVQQEDDRQGLPEGNVVEEEAAADVEEVADVKDIIKEEEQEPEIDDNLPVVELNMEEVIDDKIEQVIIESSDDNDLVYEKSDIVSDEAVGEKPIKDQIFKDESKLSLETLVNPIESNEVLNLVGLGFDYKLQGRILEAGEAFAKAYELAQGEGMRCLLGLERVYLYKEIGSYSKAKEILNELVAFTQVEPAIIKEINKQIVYIEVLIRELTRLRMGNMPASSVPRLVRLKVAEEIELLESGRE